VSSTLPCAEGGAADDAWSDDGAGASMDHRVPRWAGSGAREVAAAACQVWRAAVKRGALTFELWAGNSSDCAIRLSDLILGSTTSRSYRLTHCAVTLRAPTTQHSPHTRPARRRPPHADPSAMLTTAADSPHRLLVRLSGALAALLGHGEGADILSEENLLGRLREAGLITYPSPLLGVLLEKLPEVFQAEVLPRLGPADRTVLAQVGRPWLAAVVGSGLARAGETAGVPLSIRSFVGSAGRLAWAKANGCRWVAKTCAIAARGGRLEVLRWARENDCPWSELTCAYAAFRGHLEVLRWARENGCPWNEDTCAFAVVRGRLNVLQWLREHGCPWDARTCGWAAEGGHLQVLQWARAHGCAWDAKTCHAAAGGGFLEVLKWAREHHYPWSARTRATAAEGGHAEVLAWLDEHGAP